MNLWRFRDAISERLKRCGIYHQQSACLRDVNEHPLQTPAILLVDETATSKGRSPKPRLPGSNHDVVAASE